MAKYITGRLIQAVIRGEIPPHVANSVGFLCGQAVGAMRVALKSEPRGPQEEPEVVILVADDSEVVAQDPEVDRRFREVLRG